MLLEAEIQRCRVGGLLGDRGYLNDGPRLRDSAGDVGCGEPQLVDAVHPGRRIEAVEGAFDGSAARGELDELAGALVSDRQHPGIEVGIGDAAGEVGRAADEGKGGPDVEGDDGRRLVGGIPHLENLGELAREAVDVGGRRDERELAGRGGAHGRAPVGIQRHRHSIDRERACRNVGERAREHVHHHVLTR